MKEFEDVYTVEPRDDDQSFYETFGDDLNRVIEIHEKSPKRVWTVIESDTDENLYIVAGLHHVNRVYYVVSKEEWTHEFEEYMWADYSDFDHGE